MKAFQAYASDGRVTGETPRQAAALFFAKFPKKRKCNIVAGETDGYFFTVAYGRASEGNWPTFYKDVTKKTMETLPDSAS